MLFDELFLRTCYLQHIETTDDMLLEASALNPDFEKTVRWLLSKKEKEEDTVRVGLSKAYFLTFPQKNVIMSDATNRYSMSNLTTGGLGDNPVTLEVGGRRFDLVCSNSVQKVCEAPEIVMNVSNLRHKYLVNNRCGHQIMVRQTRLGSDQETVNDGEIRPVFFNTRDKQASRLVNIGVSGSEWTDDIRIDRPNITYTMVRNVFEPAGPPLLGFSVEKYLTLCIEVTVQDSSFVLLVKRGDGAGAFELRNEMEGVCVALSHDPQALQRNSCDLFLQPGKKGYYSYPSGMMAKEKHMFVQFLETKREDYQLSSVVQVNYEQESFSYDIFGLRVYHISVMNGMNRRITFSQIIEATDVKKLLSTMQVDIPHFGVSVITGSRSTRKEVLYLSIHEMSLVKEVYEKDTLQRIKIRYINVDNNCEYISYYPILFSPPYSYPNMVSMDCNYMEIYMKTINDNNIKNKVDVKMLGSIIKIEESFIHILLRSLEEMNRQQNITTKRNIKFTHTYNKADTDYKDEKMLICAKNFTSYKDINNNQYINEINLSSYDISFSFRREPGDQAEAALNRYSKYLKSVGFDYIFSIEDLSLDIEKFELDNSVYPLPTVQQLIVQQYKKDAIQSGISSMLDINLLGNPRKFAREIKKGLNDAVKKPGQADKKGEAGAGVSQGAGSLARHTAIGTLSSVSKITGTVADITSRLTLDGEYIKERNRIKSMKSNGGMSDYNEGVNQIGYSMKDGITGVFTRPAEMTEKEGLIGAIKGSLIGLGGLVIKPVTGMLDFASGGTQQLRNTVEDEELKPPANRIRNPRAFYNDSGSLKKYNENDSFVYNMIQMKTKQTDDNLISYKQVYIDGNKDVYYILIHTVMFVYCADFKYNIVWVLDKQLYYTMVDKYGNIGIEEWPIYMEFRDNLHNNMISTTVYFSTREDYSEFKKSINI